MKKIWEKYKYMIMIIILFFISETIFLAINQLFPFGNINSFMKSDVGSQYIPFWSYLKDCFTGNANIFYSFSNGLGGNMIGIWAYYLLSPFNLIFLIVSKIHISNTLIIITALKFLASAITMSIFLKTKIHKKLGIILGAFCYAFCGYNIAFQMNIMWLDGVILLPLIALGIEKIVKEDKPILYIITTALSLIINFYIGFATTIFGGIYFLYTLFLKKLEKKDIQIVLKFAGYSLVAIGISAVILLPVIHVLLSGRDASSLLNVVDLWKSNFTTVDFMAKLLPGTINNNQLYLDNGLPNIFCGLIISILALYYFFNPKIALKNKILSIILLAILFLSMKINIINLLWHGLKAPRGYPYRYSFVFIFMLILLASIGLENLDRKRLKQFVIVGIASIGISIVVILYKNKTVEVALAELAIIFCITYVILLTLAVLLKDRERKIVEGLLIIICIFELIYNYNYTYRILNYEAEDHYMATMEKYINIVNKIKEQDDSFYRVEKTDRQNLNDSLTYNYYGIGHSSSVFNQDQLDLLKALGYNWYLEWPSYGDGATPVLDSILGIKYKISPKQLNDEEYLEFVDEVDGYYIYKNQYALSLGILANEKLELDLTKNPFELQEDILENVTGERNVFHDCEQIHKEEKNLEVEGDYYTKQDENSQLIYTFDVHDKHEDLYLFIDTDYFYDESLFDVKINGELYRQNYIGSNNNGILHIDKEMYQGQDELTLEFDFKTSFKTEIRNIYLKEFDVDKFVSIMQEKMNTNQLNHIIDKGNKIEGTINLEEDGYMVLTIPYDETWKIEVNGEEVQYEETLGDFIGMNLTEGENKIEMKYTPKGLKIGGLISLVSITIFIVYIILCRKKEKNEKNY